MEDLVERDGVVRIATRELRPHDRIIKAPSRGLPKGAEVRLVTDNNGNPFPQASDTDLLHVFCDHGEEAVFETGETWEVERAEQLDDCRSCFLYEAVRDFDDA